MTSLQDKQIFVLPQEEGFIVYAPLAARAVLANTECVAQLQRYIETGNPAAVSPDIVRQLGGLAWLHRRSGPIPLPVDRQYHPTGVTLFLTNACNLRCRYCYAQAGEMAFQEMPPQVYRAAIDLVTRNAKRAGTPVCVSFHGGGEPTMAWRTLREVLDYVERHCREEQQCRVHLALATNGVMPPSHRAFVGSHFNHVTLSLDGPPDVQDAQRPTRGGKGSFDEVMAFVEVLRQKPVPFQIRSTITTRNVRRMTEMVDFFIDKTGCRHLHFEPFHASGRGEECPEEVPDRTVFASEFVRAMDRARARRAQLTYSATRLPGPHLSFCGCANDAFSVTPDGHLTACFEVCHAQDPLWEKYCFGRFEPASGGFAIDTTRLRRLRRLTVDRQPHCAHCFARWNCAGDCPAKNDRHPGLTGPDPARCQITQHILRAMLERALHPTATEVTA